MFAHHTSHVLLDLALLCHKAARRGDMKEAKRIAKLSAEIEKLFPEAEVELHDRYPVDGTPDREG